VGDRERAVSDAFDDHAGDVRHASSVPRIAPDPYTLRASFARFLQREDRAERRPSTRRNALGKLQ
jgi:hypothetical protein